MKWFFDWLFWKKGLIATIGAGLALFVSFSLSASSPIPLPTRPYMLPDQGCTVFYAADGDVVLGGNNEDFINPLTYVWFHPGQGGEYGWVAFGYDDFTPQGMVNDQGLFSDGLSLPYKAFQDNSKPAPPEGLSQLFQDIFSTSSTVEQAQQILSQYNLDGLQTSQLFFGDRFGHSLIVDGDTILPIQGKFQVAENFRQSEHPNPPYPGERFTIATQMLSEASTYSVDLFRSVLQAVHQEGETPTQYSQVYDLKNGIIYLYQFHDFDHVVTINIAEELAKGPHSASIASLFPLNEERERFALQPVLQYHVDSNLNSNMDYDPTQLTDFVGEYRYLGAPEKPIARVFVEDGHLFIQDNGMPAMRLYPTTGDEFIHLYFYRGTDTRVSFRRDLLGRVTGLDGAYEAPEFRILQPYQMEKTTVAAVPILWIALALGAVVVVAGAGLAFWARKRKPG